MEAKFVKYVLPFLVFGLGFVVIEAGKYVIQHWG